MRVISYKDGKVSEVTLLGDSSPVRLRARTARGPSVLGDGRIWGHPLQLADGEPWFWTKRSVEEWFLLGSRDWLKFQDLIVTTQCLKRSISVVEMDTLPSNIQVQAVSFLVSYFGVGSSTWRCQAITDLKTIVIHILYRKPFVFGYLVNVPGINFDGWTTLADCICHLLSRRVLVLNIGNRCKVRPRGQQHEISFLHDLLPSKITRNMRIYI